MNFEGKQKKITSDIELLFSDQLYKAHPSRPVAHNNRNYLFLRGGLSKLPHPHPPFCRNYPTPTEKIFRQSRALGYDNLPNSAPPPPHQKN